MKQGLRWLLTDMDRNHNLFPEGYGIMEVSGLNAELIDVAVYTQQALEVTARVARVLDEPDTAARYEQQASALKARINDRFWADDEGSYGDFYGSRAQAMSAAEGAIGRSGSRATPRLPRGTGSTSRTTRALRSDSPRCPIPAEDGSPTRTGSLRRRWRSGSPRATGRSGCWIRSATRMSAQYGPFLSAVERQAMMTIATGVQAVAEARYGRIDEALWYVDRIVQTFGRTLPGSISEMMPDYGCFAIAWTSYGVMVPLIRHVFGIQPDAVPRPSSSIPKSPTAGTICASRICRSAPL